MVDEGEHTPEKIEEAKRYFTRFKNPRDRLTIIRAEEDGEMHCTQNNLSYADSVR
jgi:hypothetical protein